MEPFVWVNVAEVIAWVTSIDLRSWPQQSHRELRPAMVTDLSWFGMGERVDGLVEEVMINLPGLFPFQQMLSVVMPGHSIEPHRDYQPPHWKFRVHIPLVTNDRSLFTVDKKSYHMEVGRSYKVNTEMEHSVDNRGEVPRIHFMFDVGRK